MMSMQFWFEFASTYSYPAAMRIEQAAEARGVAVEWRPFLLGPIFAAQEPDRIGYARCDHAQHLFAKPEK